MTPEQLDEIEKLAEAATPGPWVWRGPDEPADLWTADGKDPIVCVQTTNADIKFIRAMREHALPLVKALREAREERDEARALLAALKAEHQPADELRSELLNEIEAHAETKAEVERLKAGRDYDAKVIPDLVRELEEAKLLLSVKIGTVEAQRQLLADKEVLLRDSNAEKEAALERVEYLEETIRDNIPYAYDQGEPDEDAATPEECVEYAAGEIAQLKKEAEHLRSALRLLWEEAQDKCALRDTTFDAVAAALKEGDR